MGDYDIMRVECEKEANAYPGYNPFLINLVYKHKGQIVPYTKLGLAI